MSLSIKSPQLILWHSAFIILASIKLFTDIWNPAPIRGEHNSDFTTYEYGSKTSQKFLFIFSETELSHMGL